MPHACSDWGGLGDSASINVGGKAPEGQQAEEYVTQGAGHVLTSIHYCDLSGIQLKPLRQQPGTGRELQRQFRLLKGEGHKFCGGCAWWSCSPNIYPEEPFSNFWLLTHLNEEPAHCGMASKPSYFFFQVAYSQVACPSISILRDTCIIGLPPVLAALPSVILLFHSHPGQTSARPLPMTPVVLYKQVLLLQMLPNHFHTLPCGMEGGGGQQESDYLVIYLHG